MRGKYIFILLITLVAFFLTVYSINKPGDELQLSRNELLFRKIGHELLRSSGDDTSRVMPIKQLSANEYQLWFENPLALLPDSIISIVNNIVSQSKLSNNYIVNVVACATKENVYGFAMDAFTSDKDMQCKGRALAKGCYYIDFKFAPETKTITPAVYLITGTSLLSILLLTAFYYHKKNKKTEAQPPQQPTDNASNILIGKTLFHFKQDYIEFENIKTVLTNKESKLLYVFSSSLNELIDRDTLQKEVWENDGVIVTRSLDMFVSKLRKKLQPDASVRIINFPGKGYKLEA